VSDVVVIGAGLTGLVAAEALGRGGRPPLVLEREPEPGGACRSREAEGYTFDYTGHLLHVARSGVREYLDAMGVWGTLAVHQRRAGVMVGSRVTPYPIQVNSYGLAPEVRRDCLLGFVRAWASDEGGEAETFLDWVLDRFGDGFARHFFIPYNRKLFRRPLEELTTDWVGRYVPRPDLEEVVDGACGVHRSGLGYNATFRYPKVGGIRLLADAVAERVEGLRCGAEVAAVNLQERWVELADGERLGYRRLISTVSLPSLLDRVVGGFGEQVSTARGQLSWTRVVNLALGVEGPAPRPEHWLYFPDPELPFFRVGFPSNHGRLAPDGCHTVSVETSLDPGAGDVAGTAERAEEALAGVGLLDRGRVRVRQILVLDPAYVVFDRARTGALEVLRLFLGEHGVEIAGRWAEWKYSAMEDAVADGLAVASRVGGGRP